MAKRSANAACGRLTSWLRAETLLSSAVTLELAVTAKPAVIRKMRNLLRRRCADALVAIDRTTRTPALALRRWIPPELPGRLRFDRGDKEEEGRDSNRVNGISRGDAEPHNEEKEADERHWRLAEPQHDRSMRLRAEEIHRSNPHAGRTRPGEGGGTTQEPNSPDTRALSISPRSKFQAAALSGFEASSFVSPASLGRSLSLSRRVSSPSQPSGSSRQARRRVVSALSRRSSPSLSACPA